MIKKLFLLLFLSCVLTPIYALEQHEKLWLATNYQTSFGQDKQWLGLVFTQLRLINESHPVQTGLIEGGIGYRLALGKSIWAGYRWSGHNPYNNFYQENRLFQQLLLPMRSRIDRSILRSRLEEIGRGNQSQISLRLRERLALEFETGLINNSHPFVYDEIFFQLNKTNYTTNRLISENRLFLGINLFINKLDWWEIGYINQYTMSASASAQNKMNHIISLTYNYF
ncbi:MAG: DUF2490 domain-containing protein [Gammaproteobacteria bacterium]